MKTLLVTAALMFCLPCSAQPADSKRPNMVILVADDWGFSDVGAFGSEISTPNLDSLASKGMRFTNFHVAASCSPTRSMLLTGVDNHRNGVGNLLEAMPRSHLGKPGYQGSLAPNTVTISTLLKDSGYRTYITGKWNVGSELYNRPDKRGFDRSIVQGDTGSDNWVPTQRYLPHSAKVDWFEDGKDAVMPPEFYSTEYFVDRAIGYLKADANSKKPFFTYIGFQANHVPVQAPQSFIDKYKGRYAEGWTALREARRAKAAQLGVIAQNTSMRTMSTTQDWSGLSAQEKQHQAREMEVYAAMAEAMDFHVGRLITYLKETKQYDNTVFVFLSDNGAEGSDYKEAQIWIKTQYSQNTDRLGGKGTYGIPGPSWASASVSPLDTYKFYAGEGGIRVPMIISGVRNMPQNSINASLAHVTDITPTLLQLAGLPPHGSSYMGKPVEPIIGASLLPVLQGTVPRTHAADKPLGYELSGNSALFKGDLKLVKNLPPVGDGQWRLFNIRLDPGETKDLQLALPTEFLAMQKDYAQYAAANGVLPMPDNYSPSRQVLINSIYNYWIPTYKTPTLAFLVLLAGLGLWRFSSRRKK